MRAGQTHKAALAAWGPDVPDWIDALAKASDGGAFGSQRQVAALLRVSPTTINLLVNNKYSPRSHTEMEAKVRASALMLTIVVCPVLGVLGRPECRAKQAEPLVTCNPLSVQLYKACRGGCQYSDIGERT